MSNQLEKFFVEDVFDLLSAKQRNNSSFYLAFIKIFAFIRSFGRGLVVILSTLFIACFAIWLSWHNWQKMIYVTDEIKRLDQFEGDFIYANKIRSILEQNDDWTNRVMFYSLCDEEIKIDLDKKIYKYTKKNVLPLLLDINESVLSEQFAKKEISNYIKSFKIYLMLTGMEGIDLNLLKKWYLGNLDHFMRYTKLSRSESIFIINKLSIILFKRTFAKSDIYEMIIAYMNQSNFSNEVYYDCINKLGKERVAISSLMMRNSSFLFAEDTNNIEINYLYTKRGYRDLLTEIGYITQEISSISHLISVLGEDYIPDQMKKFRSMFCCDYSIMWKDMMRRIKYANAADIDSYLVNIKNIDSHIEVVFALIDRIESHILIKEFNDSPEVEIPQDGIPQIDAKSAVQAAKSISRSRYVPIISYKPLCEHNIKEIKQQLKSNICNIISHLSEMMTNKPVPGHQYGQMLEKIHNQESCVHQALIFAKTLPSPLDDIYIALIDNLKYLLAAETKNHINTVWFNKVYLPFKNRVAKKYPVNILNYQDQLAIEEFTKFFAPGGIFDSFNKQYLTNTAYQGFISVNTANFLKMLPKIQHCWFNKDGELQLSFAILNVEFTDGVKGIDGTLLGNQLHSFPKSYSFVDSENLVAKMVFISKIKRSFNNFSYSGPWCWYKLLALEKSDIIGKKRIVKTFNGYIGNISLTLFFNNEFVPLSILKDFEIPRFVVF